MPNEKPWTLNEWLTRSEIKCGTSVYPDLKEVQVINLRPEYPLQLIAILMVLVLIYRASVVLIRGGSDA